MGMLRLLLAVIVILNHVQFAGGPNPFIYEGFPASTAVEIFFAISGFYMALILNKKYTGVGSTWTFYVSRFTRIYPAYWAIVGGWLTVELLRLFATGQSEALSIWVKEAPTFPWDTRLYLVAMNICIIGQDLALFLHFNTDGTLACGKGNPASGSGFIFDPVWRFCLDPPAWSISLELMFYLLVPLLARRTIGVIAAVATASFIFKLWVLYG